MTKPKAQTKVGTSAWPPLLVCCWMLIALLNTTLKENPIIYLTLIGYLAMMVPATAIVLREERRRSRITSSQMDSISPLNE